LAAEGAAWRKRDFGSGGNTLRSVAALRRWQRHCGSGSAAVAGSLVTAVASWQQQLGGSAAVAVAAEARWQRGRGAPPMIGSGSLAAAAVEYILVGLS
jgi:hypothetical protein